MRKTSRSFHARRGFLSLVPIAFAGGVAAVVVARLRARSDASASAATGPIEWRCACGQAYRVSGEGRHRVFWLADADRGDPVLADRCPSCERELTAQAAG